MAAGGQKKKTGMVKSRIIKYKVTGKRFWKKGCFFNFQTGAWAYG